MKRKVLHALTLTAALSGMFLVGCEGDVGESVGEDGAALVEGAPERARGHHERGHGPLKMLVHAIDDLDLSEAQKAQVEEIFEAMKPSEAERAAFKASHDTGRKALASAVRAGSLDEAALGAAREGEPKPDKRAKMVASLDQLHSVLTPEQRAELVTSLKTKLAARGDKAEGHACKGGDDKGRMGKGHKGKGHKGKGGFGHMGKLVHQLDLTDAQKAQLTAARERMKSERPGAEGMKEHFEAKRAKMTAMLDAFAADDFRASSLDLEGPERFGAKGGKDIAMMKTLLPILDDAQRSKLADLIEQGPRGRK